DCTDTSFVFGFAIERSGILPRTVETEDVYKCSEIIHSQVASNGSDFAVIKLDRPVVDHAPLALRQSGAPPVGEPLVVIGHPSGLPTKVAGGANVREMKSTYLVANLDTYGGNSGSAVFNAV